MLEYHSIEELVSEAEKTNRKISNLVLEDQAREMGRLPEELYRDMERNAMVMKESIDEGLKPGIRSTSGLSGGDAFKLQQSLEKGETLIGGLMDSVMIKALAVAESNACMGRIVASPTAGSCGILPAVLLGAVEDNNLPYTSMVMGLFTAAGLGMVIAKRASISGAEGGCQAECGSASAMAAGALVEMMGGTPAMVGHACAIALKGSLGLVCDPVAGLVEIPCIKRNAMGAANALVATQLALAGIESVIPVDEVIDAMKDVGDLMAPSLKETGEGGLAGTPTGKRLAKEIFGDS